MDYQEKINQFKTKCREKKLKITPQRLTIYKALLADKTHPNPEKIHKAIKIENPTITLATVYKTLETFEQNGLSSIVTNLHNNIRYDPITIQHHHIVCVKCKRVIDLFDDDLDEIEVPRSVTNGNNLVNYSVHFNVVCSGCKTEKIKTK